MKMPTQNFLMLLVLLMLMLRNVLDDILVEILKLKLGRNFGQDIKYVEAGQDFEGDLKKLLVKTFSFRCGQDFEGEVLVKILTLKFGQDLWKRVFQKKKKLTGKALKLEFGQDFEAGVWNFELINL